MYCTRCGKEIRSDQKFCGNCGAKNVNYQEKNDLKEMIEKAAAGEENALENLQSDLCARVCNRTSDGEK